MCDRLWFTCKPRDLYDKRKYPVLCIKVLSISGDTMLGLVTIQEIEGRVSHETRCKWMKILKEKLIIEYFAFNKKIQIFIKSLENVQDFL